MLTKFKSYLESIAITPTSWILGVSGILMARFFLEAFSSRTSTGIIASDSSTLVHYYLFFIATILATMLFLWFAVPSWRKILPQFAAISYLIILLPPIIDFIVSKGGGFQMTYLFERPSEMLKSLLVFFGPNFSSGITVGMKIEFALILILAGILTYQTSRKILRTIISVMVLYLIIFIFVSLPGVISIFSGSEPMLFLSRSSISSASFANNLHGSLFYLTDVRALEIGFNFLMSKILFLICALLLSFWFYLSDKKKFIVVIKNSRPERVLAYFLSIILGMILAFHLSPPQFFNWLDFISILVLLLAFYLSWAFAVCVNDVADEKIDEVSNKNRPLIENSLTHQNMRQTAFIFLVMSLLGGYISGYYAFFAILAYTALYYVYSAPPARFKLIPFFSTFIIGLCNLSAALAGFFLLSNSKILATFPTAAVAGIVIFYSLLPNFRDIKDIEGDTKERIITVPVLFGPIWGPRVVGLMCALSYLLVPLFIKNYYLFLLAFPSALITYALCTRKNYKESPLFIVYFLFFFLSVALILLS